jgi:hyperosmotically inducible protein
MNAPFKASVFAALCAFGLGSLPTGCTQAPLGRSSSEYDYDTLITSAVTNQLAGGLGLRKESIKVESYRGSVTLSGFVNNEAERDRAAQVATSVPGVQSVKNDLTVIGSTAPAPAPAPISQP